MRHRNLEYLEGQLEGHRLAQRSKMEHADRQVIHLAFPVLSRCASFAAVFNPALMHVLDTSK